MGLKERYQTEVVKDLMKDFGYKNVMAVPKVSKVVINMGLGKAVQDKTLVDMAEETLVQISGQKPLRCKAKKSVSNFKLREGMEIGLKVTLRGKRMYSFLEKLLNIALPRTKDFQGISDRSFDQQGNYTFGVKEHIIFPEINFDQVKKIFGMDISVVTTANTVEESKKLLTYLGFPFRKR